MKLESDYAKRQFLEAMHGAIDDLEKTFRTYITGIKIDDINKYLVQFDHGHMTTAIRMLQMIDFYDGPRIIELVKCLYEKIKQQNGGTFENVYLCPITTDGGDSAEWMQRFFKNIERDPKERTVGKQNMLKSVFELAKLTDDSDHKLIVLLDHFIGTGDSIINKWGHVRQWQNDNHEYVVVVLVAYKDAVERIRDVIDPGLDIMPGIELPSSARAFHNDNHNFSDTEKDIIRKYCKIVEHEQRHQYGHNNSQSLVIFYDRAPNNALPVLHKKQTDVWTPLFPRYY